MAAATPAPGARVDNPLLAAIAQVLVEGLQRGATALHVEARSATEPLKVQLRIDDRLQPLADLPVAWRATLVARFKSLANLDVTETRRPQGGRVSLARALGGLGLPRELASLAEAPVKVAVLPTHDGLEDLVLHLPTPPRVLALEQIGLAGEVLERLQGLLGQRSGLVLCAGLPRSGRSTTLQAMAASLLRSDRCVWSVEDNLRRLQPGLRQTEFSARQPGACEQALQALHDADADVVLIDELREPGAAREALSLALSGRLVLAAVPARSAYDAVSRWVEQGVPPVDLAEGLLGVHHQRLAHRLCSHCRRSEPAQDAEVDEWLGLVLHGQYTDDPMRYEQARAALRADWADRYGRDGRLRRYTSPGCEHCEGQGWRGHVVLHELSVNDRELRRLVRASAPPWLFERWALHQAETDGHRGLRQDAIEKMLAGLITAEDMRAVK